MTLAYLNGDLNNEGSSSSPGSESTNNSHLQQTPSDQNSTSNLQVPDSTPQARRKRGLSLRTQLFNRALASQLINPSLFELDKSSNIEMENMHSVRFETPERSETPRITVDEAADSEVKNYYPYNTYNNNLSRSTTQLSSESVNSDASSTEFMTRHRRYKSRNKLMKGLVAVRDKIFGKGELPPTENGRIIPLAVSRDIDMIFGAGYYDKPSDSFIDERTGAPYCSNSITSSKYSVYSFLPKQLRAQFSKIANCYFLCIAIMQMVPSWSTTAREGFDDWKRHKHDKGENNRPCIKIKEDDKSSFDTHSITTIMTENIPVNMGNGDTSFQTLSDSESVSLSSSHDPKALQKYNLMEIKSRWQDVKVGDIIKIKEDEWFPADILLLSAHNESEPDTAYIETMDLDGETNLKSKTPPADISKTVSKASGLKCISQLVTVEDPNIDLYNFEGVVNINNESIPLGPENVIYRGSILRNTKSVLGLVIFTGEETKIRMNNIKNPRTKAPKLQKNINYIVIFMVMVVILLSAFSLMAQKIMYSENRHKAWYLLDQDAGTAPTLMSFIIMYNTLIPLSLYVTMEIIKVGQLLLLQCDIDMYHAESNTPADAKTATILEELGQVSYVFSDKTGTLTDNMMLFRKFSVNGVSWIHDVDVKAESNDDTLVNSTYAANETNEQIIEGSSGPRESMSSLDYTPRKSTTSVVRNSVDGHALRTATTWKSTANPKKQQVSESSIQLLKYLQTNPNTLFAKKAKFFLLSIALCSTCLPRKKTTTNNTDSSSSLEEITQTLDNEEEDQNIDYQSSSPDEKALVEAARDLGFVIFDKRNDILTLKTYPGGFKEPAKFENYQVLDVIEFSSARKRMSIVVKFPDNRICMICKGADNVIIERLKHSQMAKEKAKEISANASERKNMEADVVLSERFSLEADARQSIGSLGSIRKKLHLNSPERSETMNTIDNYLMGKDDGEINDVAEKSRKSLHMQQTQRYSLDNSPNTTNSNRTSTGPSSVGFRVDDRLLVNDEYLIEKTLEHIEEFSTEGLRTLLYSYKWIDKKEYEDFSEKYQAAKAALVDRSIQVEKVGESLEHDFELLGASAIEDKLQDGVSEAIEKLRRAGIKMWMLTGDKRETAINIGYSCRLIKDYSTVTILNIDEGKDSVKKSITSTTKKVLGGSIAHCVVVIDGATLGTIQDDKDLMAHFIDLCVVADSAVCCRASPSQKAAMVSSIRDLDQKSVTLAIGDGANDIAMIQSADIGVGITGKEGLQAARASDYAIAQFRFLLKLLLVNGRYNYVRNSKFVLCTFYKELIFYLTQALYQRNVLFSGSSVYESWSLSMFNTLFTSLPVLVVGIFDKDLHPATLLAVPELYSKGRLYKGFNLKIFVSWMVLAALQSVGISFLSWYLWGFTSLKDNTTLPLGTLLFGALVIIINSKCEFIETQNRTWLSFAAFIISVGGYGLWNVLIMAMYRTKPTTIYFVDYGLLHFGRDPTWWASLLVIATVPIYIDILIKVFKFIIKPNDDEVFRAIEKDMGMRKIFEQMAFSDLKQGWTIPTESSVWRRTAIKIINVILSKMGLNMKIEDKDSSESRKRAGTNLNPNELPPGSEGEVVHRSDSQFYEYEDVDYEILPSGKKVKKNRNGKGILNLFKKKDEDIEAILTDRLGSLKSS